MPEIKKLVIAREKWGRNALLIGRLRDDSGNDEGKMCCLGHLAKACGSSDNDLLDLGMPSTNIAARYPKAIRGYGSRDEGHENDWGFCTFASEINDSDHLSGADKERRLKVLFRSRGIRLSFTGKGRP